MITTELKCYAKINLCLTVNGKRDDGYHLIDTVMQNVDIYDILTVNKSDKISVGCSKSEFDGEKNIAYTAAKSFFEYTKINGGAEIYIEKGIPDAAGLGGGSSDAAGVLTALNKLYSANLSLNELLNIAVKSGADVPFFLSGGTMRAKGIGEILEPLPTPDGLYFLIAKNGEKPSTAQMYRQLDNTAGFLKPDTESFANALLNGDKMLTSFIGNSFQSVTGLYGIDSYLKSTGYKAICLSGSGPSVFAVYQSECDCDIALNILKSKSITAFKSVPIDRAFKIIE